MLPSCLYRPSLAALTDLYELTMACGYFKAGVSEREAVFNLTFRTSPFNSGYAVACGLAYVVDSLRHFHFANEDIEHLATLRGNDGRPLFEPRFLEYLRELRLACDVDAIPEGTLVFPHEPLIRVRGPVIHAQILESAVLNFINFQTLIATKAARVCWAAQGDPVIEFGLRRAQGIDGALTVARAAYVGGCTSTSDVLAGRLFNIPVAGTHAHSWIMVFDSELEAFEAYAQALPNNCTFLVDTYNTLAGVRHAVEVARRLRARGHEIAGIRLDSGDLAYLAIRAAKMLDEAGFPETTITLSGDLDELVIWQIVTQIRDEAPRWGLDADHVIKRLSYGVGTRLITSAGEPALGGVYKLVAVCDKGNWVPAIKVSDSADKTPNPGHKNVWRLYDQRGTATADLLTLDDDPRQMDVITLRHPSDPSKFRTLERSAISEIEPLLVKVLDEGRLVIDLPPIEELRARRQADVDRLDPGVKRLINPHIYHVSLSDKLWDLKQSLIASLLKNRG